MIVAIVFDTDDTELVDSLSMAAEWDEGISISHPSGVEVIEKFRFVDTPEITDFGVRFEISTED